MKNNIEEIISEFSINKIQLSFMFEVYDQNISEKQLCHGHFASL